MRQAGDIKWCDLEGLPCTLARQQDLKSVQNTKNGIQKTSASDVVFRDPDYFVAGELHNHLESWNFVLEGYHKRDEIIKYLMDGVSIFDFMKPFNGEFKGVKYNSPTPPSIILPNSKSCNDFEDFISRTIIERVSNGSLAVWGKKGDCSPPHLVMPMTIEPSKPRLCHDERFLNLWTKGPPICFDPITDLPRYVGEGHFQVKLDDKSGYDHVRLSRDSSKFFGLAWKNWFFVYTTLPFGWSPSAYVYQTIGLGVSSFIRAQNVPLTQYIDDRHVGQLHPTKAFSTVWSNLELSEGAAFITALTLTHCGYFIGLQKSVLRPVKSLLFLGFICDSTRQAFVLPQDKKENFAVLRESIISSKCVTVNTLQRFAGKAVSFSLAIPAAKLFVREVNQHISKGLRNSKAVTVSISLKEELKCWRFLDSWKECLPWRDEKHYSVKLCSDASNSGWGGILSLPEGKLQSGDYWKSEDRSSVIAVKEVKALHNTLLTFNNYLSNARVDAYVDNQNLIAAWNNEGGKNSQLNDEIKGIFRMCLDLDISLQLVYTPTNLMEADAPSRFRADIDCRLSEDTWAMVDRRYGPHDVDLMATPSNVRTHRNGHQLRFFSPVPCPGSDGVNVFAQSFSATENYYVFPPFVLIGPLIRFFGTFKMQLTLVSPDVSPKKYWWPLLISSSVDSILIGRKGQPGIIWFPPDKKQDWHTRPLPWNLYAFRLNF